MRRLFNKKNLLFIEKQYQSPKALMIGSHTFLHSNSDIRPR